jgi:hypothetical protein
MTINRDGRTIIIKLYGGQCDKSEDIAKYIESETKTIRLLDKKGELIYEGQFI